MLLLFPVNVEGAIVWSVAQLREPVVTQVICNISGLNVGHDVFLVHVGHLFVLLPV